MSRISNISAIEQVLEMIEGYDENAEHNHAGMQFIQGVILGLGMGDVITMEQETELRERLYDVYDYHKEENKLGLTYTQNVTTNLKNHTMVLQQPLY